MICSFSYWKVSLMNKKYWKLDHNFASIFFGNKHSVKNAYSILCNIYGIYNTLTERTFNRIARRVQKGDLVEYQRAEYACSRKKY